MWQRLVVLVALGCYIPLMLLMFIPGLPGGDLFSIRRVYLLREPEPAAWRPDGAHAQPRFGDGCYHVFLDLGSNRGVHGRFVFEPEKYPDNGLENVFFQAFGSHDRQHMPLCVFAFEPNPSHVAAQRATEGAYRRMGWSYTFFNVGVGPENTTMKFFSNGGNQHNSEWGLSTYDRGDIRRNRGNIHDSKWGVSTYDREHIRNRKFSNGGNKKNSKWGLSTHDRRYIGRKRGSKDNSKRGLSTYDREHMRNREFFSNGGNKKNSEWNFSTNDHEDIGNRSAPTNFQSLPVVDLVAWMQLHILPRRIPVWNQNRSKAVPPRLVIKMDIEGLELALLTKMLASGVLCKVDTLFMELHRFQTLMAAECRSNSTCIQEHFNSIQRSLVAANCSSILEFDSEKYRLDGMPYPSPP